MNQRDTNMLPERKTRRKKGESPEGAQNRTRKWPIYIVECDAQELTEFHVRRNDLIPKHNQVNDIADENGKIGMYGDSRWYGGIRTWDEAVKLLREGWPQGVKAASELAAKIGEKLPEPESLRRRSAWGDDGGELDYDRFRSQGIEGSFRRTVQKVQLAPRTVRIVANWAMNAGMSAEQIMWNGGAMIALLDLLEKADYSTELSLAFPTKHIIDAARSAKATKPATNHISMPVIRVKTAGDVLSVNAVAGVASHAGVYRSLGFAALCSTPYQVDWGLGRCINAKEAYEEGIKQGLLETPDAYMETANSEATAFGNCVGALRQVFTRDLNLLQALDRMQYDRLYEGIPENLRPKYQPKRYIFDEAKEIWRECNYLELQQGKGVE